MGRVILLHAEQGFGDTLEFARYAPLVERLGARVLLEVQPPLKRLMGTLPFAGEIYAQGDTLPAFDFQCPLLSLPLAFGTVVATIPWEGAYLSAEESRLHRWQRRLGEGTLPRIGLVWSGSFDPQKSHLGRSILLEAFGELLSLPVEWVCLQKEIGAGDRAALPRFKRLRQFSDEIDDFTDTAALIACCDLVISIDTAVAHLAGAMGKPVWVLLPYVPDWRWLLDREDCPWYPTARLFRQPRFGDWVSVVQAICKQLHACVCHKSNPHMLAMQSTQDVMLSPAAR